MIITGRIVRYDGVKLTIVPDEEVSREILQKQVGAVEIRLDDGRTISADQRKKIFATIRDISLWSGHDPEYLRTFLTWDFLTKQGGEWFSLSDVDMTTARQYLTYLIEFCFTHSVPTRDTLLDRTDDIDRYLYLCLEHRKCAVCNAQADIHHVTRIGMGRDRKQLIHSGMEAIALCREHHTYAHTDEKGLFEKYHIYGIKLDDYLCKKLGLNTEAI